MTEILVLVDHADGAVRKTTLELLTIARRLGEPSAVYIGDAIEQARETLKQYGAERVYVLDDPDLAASLVAPKAEVLAHLVERQRPAAVLLTLECGGQGDRRPACDQDRVRTGHGCR